MRAERPLRIAALALLWGAAALRGPLPGETRFALALGALLVFPGLWIAGRLRPGSPLRVQAALAYGVSHGILALSALLFRAAGLPLRALLVPLALFGAWSALATPAPGPDTKRRTTAWVLLGVALLFVALSGPRTGFLTDAYDHLGSIRFQAARGDLFPGEYFHEGRETELDPRKGTNHTAFALACSLAGIDPGSAYPVFWGAHIVLAFLTVFWLAETVLGGRAAAWTATACFALLFRAGFADEWYGTAGYPGKAGLLLTLMMVAVAVESARRKRRTRGMLLAGLLGAGAAGVHAFSAPLAWLGTGSLGVGMLLHRRLRRDAGGPFSCLLAGAIGAAPLLVFRFVSTYSPSNPIHLHRQGVLLLPGKLPVIDPVTLLQVIGLAGCVSFLLLPFIASPHRGFGPGEMYLVAASLAVLLLLLAPLLFPLVESKMGYLARRIPLIIVPGLIPAAVLRRGWEGRWRPGAVLPAAAVLAAVAVTAFAPAASAVPRRALPHGSPAETAVWLAPLSRLAAAIPPESTVLTDPVTGYALFGMARIHPVAILDQHASPNDAEAPRRLAESQRFLRGRPDGETGVTILDHYNVDYILINELFPRDFKTYNAGVHLESFRACRERLDGRPERFPPMSAPEGLHLYRVVPGPAAGPAEAPRADAPAGGPEVRVRMGDGLFLLDGRYRAESAHRGEGAWLVTRWELRGADAGALPMRVYVRAQPEGRGAPERLSLRRDPVRTPWNVFPLGGEAYPYLLWRNGEVVADSHYVRVPQACPAGAYAIEVAVEEAPFFPVRMIRGLERGAMRTGWTVIDTVEVLP